MKVMFVTPPYHCGVVEVAGRWIPLQFIYLAGAVRAAGHEAVIYDAMSKWHTHEQITERIAAENPDVIAMSVITSTYPDGVEVLRNARRILPEVKTIMGGVHAHFMFEEIFNSDADAVDLILKGEGENSIVMALEAFGSPDKMRRVPGAIFVDGDEIYQAPTAENIIDLDALPTAYDLVDWPDYKYFVIKDSRLGAVSTSRGCSHDCTFCSQQKFWERTWRGRDPAKVVEEIAGLKKDFGVNVFLLTDEYPTSDQERWEKILDLLIKADLGVYLLIETRVEDILRDEEFLWKYRKAGIVHVYLGVEATDQETLDLMKKDIQVEQSQQALALVKQHGMVTETSFVLGMPTETKLTVDRTLRLSQHFDPDNAHFLAITPWPYADLYDDLKQYIKVWDYRKYNLIEPIIEPVNMTLQEIDIAIIDCYRRFYMGKMTEFIDEPDPFRRRYLLLAARLIMKSSFIRDKLGTVVGIPPEMKKIINQISKIII